MTHLHEAEVHQGARFQSWSESNPRPILKKIVDDNPAADDAQIWKLFWAKIGDRQDVYKTMAEGWFANNNRKPLARASQNEIRKEVDYVANEILMSLPMPNGKRLQDLTKEECEKAGGWLTRVAAKVPARKKVGEVLTEDDLAKLWKKR